MNVLFNLKIRCFLIFVVTSALICQGESYRLTRICSEKPQDTLFVSKLGDKEWSKKYSNSTQFSHIAFEDGSVLAVGDTLRLGSPSGSLETFKYIILGRMGAMLTGFAQFLPETFKNRDRKIVNIKIWKAANKDGTSQGQVILQNPTQDILVYDVVFALQFGELINPKATITSEQALAELKKAKDKLDLGIVTQEYYDSLKTVLSKYIR